MTSDEDFIKSWTKLREAGKQTYAVRGALLFSFVFTLFRELVHATLFNRDNYSFNTQQVLLNLFFISIVMYFYKLWTWSNNEKRYNKLTPK